MTRLHGRVAKIEKKCGESREVARMVGMIRRASDEKLYWLNKSGQLARMAERLNEQELSQLIAELKAMKAAPNSPAENRPVTEEQRQGSAPSFSRECRLARRG